jgi:hypothetical protein
MIVHFSSARSPPATSARWCRRAWRWHSMTLLRALSGAYAHKAPAASTIGAGSWTGGARRRLIGRPFWGAPCHARHQIDGACRSVSAGKQAAVRPVIERLCRSHMRHRTSGQASEVIAATLPVPLDRSIRAPLIESQVHGVSPFSIPQLNTLIPPSSERSPPADFRGACRNAPLRVRRALPVAVRARSTHPSHDRARSDPRPFFGFRTEEKAGSDLLRSPPRSSGRSSPHIRRPAPTKARAEASSPAAGGVYGWGGLCLSARWWTRGARSECGNCRGE